MASCAAAAGRAGPHNRAVPHQPPLNWDIFCRVIDNHGDVGVSWRLARELGARGHRVRLWLDDPERLPALAPGALQGRQAGVRVLPWRQPFPLELLRGLPPADVWVEAFGCTLPEPFVAQRAQSQPGRAAPVWINLEYLSAESFPSRSHGLPSPVGSGPAAGWTKWFFYPGFQPATGGLLREQDLMARQAAFDRAGWLQARLGVSFAPEACHVSLFCYEPPALRALLRQLQAASPAVHLLATAGRASAAVRALRPDEAARSPAETASAALDIHFLPFVPQAEFDELLWACDLNFVRGEDSLVRALWAGQPFVWQPYVQHDGVHARKLDAFLDWLQPPAAVRQLHRAWSGLDGAGLPLLSDIDWHGWRDGVRAARARLLAQPDLVTQLLDFVSKKR